MPRSVRASIRAFQGGKAKASIPKRPKTPLDREREKYKRKVLKDLFRRPRLKEPKAPKQPRRRVPNFVPFPEPNCQWSGQDVGDTAYPGALYSATNNPGHLAARFAEGQEASEGDAQYQWTHILSTKAVTITFFPLQTALRPIDNFPAGYVDETQANTRLPIVGIHPKAARGVRPAPSADDDTQYWVVFVEKVNRKKSNEFLRVYLRRRGTVE